MSRSYVSVELRQQEVSESLSLVCDICGEMAAKTCYIQRSYGDSECLSVIKDIPVITCIHCGESYLTSNTLHEIEHLKGKFP